MGIRQTPWGPRPDDWELIRWRQFARRAGEPITLTNGADVRQVTVRVRHQGVVERRINKARRREILTPNQTVVRAGQFIISKIDARNGACGFIPKELEGAVVTSDFPVYEICDPADTRYLDHLVALPDFWRLCESASDGTTNRVRLDLDQFDDLVFPLPPLPEQRAIAAVLDAIDEAIERTQAVIAATETLRKALLHDLLSRGVPGWHTEWKHVPGIGTIPACWDVVRLGDVLIGIDAGRSPKCESRPAMENEWGVLKVSALSWGEFLAEENKALPAGVAPDPSLEVKPGDLLLSRANTPDLVGRAVLVRKTRRRLLLCDKTLRLVPNTNSVDAPLLRLLLETPGARVQIEAAATGSSRSMYNISQQSLSRIHIQIPPVTEGAVMTQVVSEIDNSLEEEQADLLELRHLKAAVGDALLTGRVRVRAPERTRA